MQISRRTAVTNIREVWPNENEFSDWLTTADGIAVIAEDIGVQIEDATRECQSENFICDIVGSVSGEPNHKVVIENQFGPTDHDHLGKLLTYAAVHSATTAIWIAESVREDHRKVLDWLNEVTPDSVNLYLARLKAYRIGDSPVAPQMDVVVRPNMLVKNVRDNNAADRQARLAFWRSVHSYFEERAFAAKLPSPSEVGPTFDLGRPGFRMWIGAPFAERKLRCGLLIRIDSDAAALDALLRQRQQIEAEVGHPLEWRVAKNGSPAYIRVSVPFAGLDVNDPAAAQVLLFDIADQFYKAIHERVLQLGAPVDDSSPA